MCWAVTIICFQSCEKHRGSSKATNRMTEYHEIWKYPLNNSKYLSFSCFYSLKCMRRQIDDKLLSNLWWQTIQTCRCWGMGLSSRRMMTTAEIWVLVITDWWLPLWDMGARGWDNPQLSQTTSCTWSRGEQEKPHNKINTTTRKPRVLLHHHSDQQQQRRRQRRRWWWWRWRQQQRSLSSSY